MILILAQLQKIPNGFYTDVTRARKFAILAGSKRAIDIAVDQMKDQHRYTSLAHRLEATTATI